MLKDPVVSGAPVAGLKVASLLTVSVGLVLITCSVPATIPALPGLPASFWAMACLVVLGELRPLGAAVVTKSSGTATSTALLLAILYGWGLWPAVLLGGIACLIGARWRSPDVPALLFRVCAAAVAVAAGWLVLVAADLAAGISGAGQELYGVDLLWLVLAWGVWFLVDHALAATTSSVPARSLVDGIRADLVHSVVVTAAVLAVLPLVVVSAQESVWFLVALLLTLVVAHETGRLLGARRLQAAGDRLPDRQRLVQVVGHDLASRQPYVLAVVEIDALTDVTDNLGRQVADRLLTAAAHRIRAAFAPGVIIGRLEGDGLAIYLPGATSGHEALELANRVRAALGDPFRLGETLLDVEVTIGLALHPAHGVDVDALICRADVALRLAKGNHSCVEVYDADTAAPDTDRLDVCTALRSAFDAHQLELAYLPRVAMRSRQLEGVEALLRWEHPTRGTIAGDELIRLAETSGLMTRLTMYLIDAALEQVGCWRAQGLDFAVAVSVSARDLHSSELVRAVSASLARHRVPSSQLQLLLTVRSLFADGTRAVDTLVALQVRDSTPGREEFGNGHASLVEVRGLPVTGITIDSSYVKTLPTGGRDLSLLRTIIELAHSLGLTAVIDGVNTQAAWRDLVDLGCDSAQGWLVAPVMPPEALPGWLGRRETGSIDFLVDQESADAPASIAAVRSKLPVSDQIGVRCPASARHS